MASRAKHKKTKTTLALMCVIAILCLVVELGSRYGFLDIKSWFGGGAPRPVDAVVDGSLDVHFLDVGNADCILLCQEDSAMLIDAGERGDRDDILAYLRKCGIDKLDIVIATHPHADHIGSMDDVINEVEIGQFLMTFMPEEDTPTTAVYLNMLEALDRQQVAVTEVLPGDTFQLGDAQVEILAPIKEDSDPNAMSVVARVTFGNHSFLFTGDAEESVEEDILISGKTIHADVLKVGHHGSSTGTCKEFLQAVSPTYAVITCGEGNSYGHPHRETLAGLEDAGVTMYRSDLHGRVIMHSDGTLLTIDTEKELS